MTDFLFTPFKYKRPSGAVYTGSIVKIEFPVALSVSVLKVTLKLRDYEGKDIAPVPLLLQGEKEGYSLYSADFKAPKAGIYYYRFEVLCPDGVWFIGRNPDGGAIRGDFLPEWQLTVCNADYITPDFIKGGIIYHIFVDRFATSGPLDFRKNGILKSSDLEVEIHSEDGTYLANDYYGGNFKGITEKLDYLKSLNVTMLYLSPIFKSGSNHRYDTGDYMQLDELLGTEEDFRNLIFEAECRGIGIMLDGVFNHTGADSLYFNKFGTYDSVGAYQSKKSPYYKWFTFKKFPDEYECWWGIKSVPTIVKSNKAYRKLLLGQGGIIDKWTAFGIKGWRLDVVDELPFDLVDEIREKVKAADPEVMIMGEVWEDASVKVSYGTLRPYFTGGQLDGVMNYPFREAIIYYLTTGDAIGFKRCIMNIVENYPKEALNSSMTLLGTHDTIRIINALSGITAPTKKQRRDIKLTGKAMDIARAKVKAASVIQYTLPGVPSVFYGDEAGLQGYEDPLNRRFYPWGREDKELVNHYIRLGEIRAEHREALTGSIRFLESSGNLLMFIRETKGETLLTIVNASGKKQVWTNPEKGVNLLNRQIINKGENEIQNNEALIIAY